MANQKRGSTLLTTLSSVGILTTLGFVLSQMCVEHLAVAGLKSSRQASLDLARSAVSQTLARLSEDAKFGTRPATPLVTVVGEHPQDQGRLVFDQDQARQLGIPYSLNNFEGTSAQPGGLGKPVPPATAHLIAVGQAGGQSRRLEVTVALPPFPFAVASSGPIRATGGVQIAGIPALPGTPGALQTMQLSEADLASNDGSPEAVFLGPGTHIQGSVQAVGRVALDPSAPDGSIKVLGSIKSNADHEAIPGQKLSKYDPMISGDDFTPIETSLLAQGANRLAGRVRRAGSLEVRDGLQLDGCVLFVDGDLKVSGGLKGKGAVIATGTVNLLGQSQFESGNGVAVMSGKDTHIEGSGPAGSFLQGLVYTQGRFSADRVTLIGALIADDESSRSPVSLTDARVFLNPNPSVRFEVKPVGSGNPPPPPPPGLGPVLGSFSLNVFDKETGFESVMQVQLNQGQGGVWVQVGPYPVEFIDDPALVLDCIAANLSFYSYQPIRPLLTPILTSYNPNWQPPPPGTGGPQPPSAAVVTIDPSSFLKIEERMRVVLWREDR